MGYLVSNHDFTHGELSKSLFARSDLNLYNKSAAKINNFVVLPGGGARSRFGSKVDEVITAAIPAAATGFQTFSWIAGEFNYLIIVSNVSGAGGIVVANVTAPTAVITTLTNPFTAASVLAKGLKGAQFQNEFIMVNETAPVQVFTADGAGAVTLAALVFKNPPTYQYLTNYTSQVFTLSAKIVTLGSVSDSLCPTLHVSGGSFAFTADFVGGYFEALGNPLFPDLGKGQIVEFVAGPPAHVRVRISQEFGQLINVGTQCFVSQTAYNTVKFYPATVAIYEDRLCLGGGVGTPQTLYMSVVGDFTDFNMGSGLASDAISFTMGSGSGSNKIQNLVSARSLQVFTESNEQASPVWGNDGISPTNVAIRVQTSKGSVATTPVIIDTATIFVKRGGRALMAFIYGLQTQSYSSEDASVTSEHLIQHPAEMTSYTHNTAYDTNLLLICQEEGDLIAYQTLQEQGVTAFTKTTTYVETDPVSYPPYTDKWKNVCAVEERVYFITERVEDDGFYVEELSWNVSMDCAEMHNIAATGNTTVTLGDQFKDRLVQIVKDIGTDPQCPTGTFIGAFRANATNQVTFDAPEIGDYWFGLGFDAELETLPAHVMAQTGDTLYLKKTINKIYVQYIDSYPFQVNNVDVTMENLDTPSGGGIVLDAPVEPKDGIFAVPTTYGGWSRSAQALIKTIQPLPITILGLSVELTA